MDDDVAGIQQHPVARLEGNYRRCCLPWLSRIAGHFSLLEEAHRKGGRFFLYLNYMDAHWPLIPPEPYDSVFPGKNRQFMTEDYFRLLRAVLAGQRHVSRQQSAHLNSQYDGGIAFMDRALNQLMRRLREMGVYENSLIIVTADHGEAFGERDLLGHLVSVHQEEVHVPLIIKFPGVRQKALRHERVSGVDVMPTILDVLGYPLPPGLEGRSVRSLKEGEGRILFSESYPSPGYVAINRYRFQRQERAVFSGSLKLISSTAGKRALYDLARDPGERDDLCRALTAECSRLQITLMVGARLVEVETADDIRRAINDKTAALTMVLSHNSLGHKVELDQMIEIAHKAGLPVILDAAAEVPPPENLSKFVKMGTDLVAFSGGKNLRGPQCSGILMGRKDLIEAAYANSSPNNYLAREAKVGKEEIVGLLAAVELCLKKDHAAERREFTAMLNRTAERLKGLPGVTTEFIPNLDFSHSPRLSVQWDEGETRCHARPDGEAPA